ncbi:BBE domain-containing protein [Streptomyces sp. P9-2B-2]|uniref:FAD-binding oxidoreductase n=1 Tax=Streptomyces sp. P9-2B-2 TaxID=3057114 RepID=UPI0025B3CDFC|nr:BBE domain-containing protein [Streptomyces sp. P9-2B-2]WJY36473.1 BBE domain-containing protein [Streptomyces sp. P9-2B-2]
MAVEQIQAGVECGIEVGRGDARYEALRRGFNQRFIATPDYVSVVSSTGEVVAAVNKYLASHRADEDLHRRLTVRSGGHCYENFVCGKDVGVIVDMGQLDRAYLDQEMGAYCVESGANNWHVATHLYAPFGVALPGGSCYSVGTGGHVVGGGYGLLSRQHGLTVDYLYAVEVVVVRDGQHAEVVIARRDSPEPELRELWWAHTGGGGGNFGVVTRYWFKGLPEPPSQVLLHAVAWPWEELLERPERLKSLVRNYGLFFEYENTTRLPASLRGDYSDMFTLLKLNQRANGKVGLITQLDATRPDSVERLNAFLDWITQDLDVEPTPLDRRMGEHAPMCGLVVPTRLPWLTATQTLNGSGDNQCGKYKSAYMRRGFTEAQLDAIYRHLSTEDYDNPQALLQVDSYGGAINLPDSGATAVYQRSSVLKLQYQTYWSWDQDANHDDVTDYLDAEIDPAIAAPHLRWIREFYRDVYQDTGGVPILAPADAPAGGQPEPVTDGCYINYPDTDLDDPEWNRSGESSHRLYYGDNYARLQAVKEHWDPRNVFRHAQSIQPYTR